MHAESKSISINVTLVTLLCKGDDPAVRAVAPDVQRGLVSLLADANEGTQELAGKALSMLFDKCDEETQDKIVKELVSSLIATD